MEDFMKKLLLVIATLFIGTLSFAAGSQSQAEREHEFHEDTLYLYSANITLDQSVAGNVSTVTIPTKAKGFRIYAASAGIRFAVGMGNQVPTLAAVANITSLGISSSSLAIGGMTKVNIWEQRLLPFDGSTRRLSLRAPTTGAVLDLEFFK
jgi:hypothetical protein